jgi:HAD superfamily hydrolase (TIGR01509 family)
VNKLIIFDCDGVLVDSEIIANRIDAHMMTQFGYAISTEESIKKFTGMNSKSVREYILKESGIELPECLSKLTGEAIVSALEKELQPLMLSVLSHDLLKSSAKCVASSSPKERIALSLRVTAQNHFFPDEHIFTSAQVKHGKPAPDLFLFAAEQMGYKPEDCLVIEDSIAGIHAARAAAIPVIGFLGGSHAQFDWYKKRILDQGVPVAHYEHEVLSFITNFITGNGRYSQKIQPCNY